MTGPGRPEGASVKARRNISGTRSGAGILNAHFAIGAKVSRLGTSCSIPLPRDFRELWPNRTTKGTQSVKALTMAVKALHRPGPLVTNATPGSPQLRA